MLYDEIVNIDSNLFFSEVIYIYALEGNRGLISSLYFFKNYLS